MPVFIRSKLGDLVIDIQGVSNTPGTLLDAFTQKPAVDANNQLWTWVPAPNGPEGYYFLQNPSNNLVIDIQERFGTPKPGTGLCAFTMKAGTAADNQRWAFQPGPDNYFWIQSLLNTYAIDIEGNRTTPGTGLDAFPQKPAASADNQLWQLISETGIHVPPPPPPSLPNPCQALLQNWYALQPKTDPVLLAYYEEKLSACRGPQYTAAVNQIKELLLTLENPPTR